MFTFVSRNDVNGGYERGEEEKRAVFEWEFAPEFGKCLNRVIPHMKRWR